ncbi:uncharacterized protein LY89DRAFT_685898 [Mollisia scopiformis]|uniref:Uncharacterized protein n=1 Tax=Mollisia scopiformis TaxID=149040 RepID=A0A194X7A1_MOLSC|nr:uncharacterized protein LY89DRAFT_685898 [Mollisia scopiformis]KUJ16048.1 hypothetical protein LY89DRAFT_685898 [Mollisia scopiformis]
MAEDFIELGIEGIDKLVDKHFHKLPDKYTNPHTYDPRRKLSRRRGSGEESDEESTRVVDEQEKDTGPPYNDAAYITDPKDIRDPGYPGNSRDPRDPRESYYPNRPPEPRSLQDPSIYSSRGYEYLVPPPPPNSDPSRQDIRQRPRREALVRRSSSQPGSLRESDRRKRGEGSERERGQRERRRRRSFSDERRRDRGPSGGNGNGGGQNKTEKVMLTLLGAAVGGLAASAAAGAVMDRLDKKSGKGDDIRVGGRAKTQEHTRGSRDKGQGVKGGGKR